MRQTKRLPFLIAVSLLITALPQQVSAQRIPIFRPPPRPIYRPPVIPRAPRPVIERPFTTLDRFRTPELPNPSPFGVGRTPPRRGYESVYPTSETKLAEMMRELEVHPWSHEKWLAEYTRIRAEWKEAALKEEQLREQLKVEIKQHQTKLKSLGYYSSRIDGVEGPETKEAVRSFLSDNFPTVKPSGYPPESDFANPQIKSLISLSYDLSISAKIIHGLDREKRLALINRSRSILGFADERESTDIYIASSQLAEVKDNDSWVIRNREKGTKVDAPAQPANLIVVRYFPKRDRQKFEILTGTGATARLYAHVSNRVDPPGQDRTIGLVPVGKESYVVTADSIFRLSAQQVASLKRGIALEDSNPLSAEIAKAQGKPLIIYNHPLTQRNQGMRQAIGQLASGLQRSYPLTKIVRTDFSSANTLENISALMNHEVKVPDDVVVVFDRSLDRVQTFGAIENSRFRLKSSGVQILDYTPGKKWELGQKKSVIVITGHINARLEKLIEALCKDGYFAGNFVVFNSCFDLTGLSTRAVETMRHRCGALGVFRFNTKIHPLKVTEFLNGVADTVGTQQPISLYELINKNLPRSMSAGWEAYNWPSAGRNNNNAGN